MAEDSVAQDQLRAFIERIERMEEEKAAIASDIKEIYAEAKGNGFDTKILRKIVAIRKQDANERMEQEAVLDLYMGALGMIAAPPEDDEDYSPRRAAPASNTTSEMDSMLERLVDQIEPALLLKLIEGSKTEAGRQIILSAIDAVKDGESTAPAPSVAAADVAVEAPESTDPVRWEREPAVEPTRHPYSKAFGTFGQDHCVIQDDIEGAKSEPIVMLGDQVLDGWARFNCARCTKTLTGETTQYPVREYDGTDPLVDCIRWNMNGRLMSEGERANVAAILTKAEPKRKRDIFASLELSMEQIA